MVTAAAGDTSHEARAGSVIDARHRFEAKARADIERDLRLELFDWLDFSVDLLSPHDGTSSA